MAQAQKALTNANDELVMAVPQHINGGGSVHYGAGGLGTIVVEGHNGLEQSGAKQWFAIGMKSFADDTVVADLSAAGAAYFNSVGLKEVRVRKSVAGAGPVDVSLNVEDG